MMNEIDIAQWRKVTDLDPITVSLFNKVLDSNNTLMHTVGTIVEMNDRIIKGLIPEFTPEDNLNILDEESL